MAPAVDALTKFRARRSVLVRTRPRKDLPEAVLYLEWLSSEGKRKVLDAEGKEHVLPDAVVQSNYKLASGPEADKLVAAHWKKDVAPVQEPVRKSDSQ